MALARRRHGLGEDDGAVGSRTAWVDSIMGSGMAQGAHHHGLMVDDNVAGSGIVSRAWGRRLRDRRHHRLGSGMMAVHKGLDHGWET
jgi:hypothetical protein